MILIIFYKLGGIFIAPVMTAAMTDTLTHKSFVINMNENSYRIKETKTWLESLHVAPAVLHIVVF
ncbi:ATP-binding protein [Clostridium ihumii]|uniref:ATP-binding protein n=1 Tax=Clostridium ihumii TaxID=1470356 RepID=UPI003D328E17